MLNISVCYWGLRLKICALILFVYAFYYFIWFSPILCLVFNLSFVYSSLINLSIVLSQRKLWSVIKKNVCNWKEIWEKEKQLEHARYIKNSSLMCFCCLEMHPQVTALWFLLLYFGRCHPLSGLSCLQLNCPSVTSLMGEPA